MNDSTQTTSEVQIETQIVDPETGIDRMWRAAKITCGVGIAHAVLLLIAFGITRYYGPGTDETSEKYVEFYQSDSRQQLVLISGIYLIPFAGIAFIWFIVALRIWFQEQSSRVDTIFHNLILVCGIIYVALLFSAGAALSLVALDSSIGDGETEVLLSSTFTRYGSSLFLIFALRMAAMVVFATTTLARKSGALPRWFVLVGIPVGLLLLLTSSIDPRLVLVFPTWLIVLSLLLLRRGKAKVLEAEATGSLPAELL